MYVGPWESSLAAAAAAAGAADDDETADIQHLYVKLGVFIGRLFAVMMFCFPVFGSTRPENVRLVSTAPHTTSDIFKT